MSTKADVLRRIADAMDEGAPTPTDIAVYMTPMRMLFMTRETWEAWAWVFRLIPTNAVYDAEFMPEGKTKVSLANDDVEIFYHQVVES